MRVASWILLYAVLWLLLFDVAIATDFTADKLRFVSVVAGVLLASFPETFYNDEDEQQRSPAKGFRHRTRERKFVGKMFNEHGPGYTRRAYRMKAISFWKLEKMLRPYMMRPRSRKVKAIRKRDGARNGRITTAIRLSAAIRYFSGGRPDDITLSHGISHSEVFNSVWLVVDAVNKCPQLEFHYPTDHADQREIAKGFRAKSDCKFNNCAGAIDGMLLWTEKPTEASCLFAKCTGKRFFCGRKHKFGLNFQAIVDSRGRFLDIAAGSPASTSDFLAFTLSQIYRKLEGLEPGYARDFLAPGLCFYGDAAYVNNRYMSTPFKMAAAGGRFDFNYFHSQLRINVECAFGMLVNRWGLLRRAMPAAFGIRKTNSMLMCLCRLHNFCINENGRKMTKPLAADTADIRSHGGIETVATADNPYSPEALLHGGEHEDDHGREERLQFARRGLGRKGKTPRDGMLKIVEDGGFKRPTPRHWV